MVRDLLPPRGERSYGDAMLEDPGRFYWKWLAVGGGLLVLYAIERTIRTSGPF